MHKILLIGAGNIGSRHLQGLAKIDIPVIICVFDTNNESLKIAKERFLQMPENEKIKEIRYCNNFDLLDNEYDLCIIATNADVRAKIITKLLNDRRIKYFLLEKFLFQTIKDLNDIQKLFENKNIKAWVNCPNRIMPVYQKIKNYFKSKEQIFYTVQGGDWRLASNSIHYLDLLNFFTDEVDFKINLSGIDNKIKKSKRDGFKEISGTLVGYLPNNSMISLISNRGNNSNIVQHILGEKTQIIIDQTNQTMMVAKEENNWIWENIDFKIINQSDLSNLIAKDILLSEKCGLISYSDSVIMHKALLKPLIKKYNEIEQDNKIFCPIT